MKSSNISFNGFKKVHYNANSNSVMTLDGTLNKTFLLTLLVFLGGFLGWTNVLALPFGVVMFGTVIISLIIVFTLMFKPLLAKYLAPVYALLEGVFLGMISLIFENYYPGIIVEAVLLTFVIALVMNVLYRNKIIRVTEKFRSIMMVAMFSVFGVYLLSIILNLFGTEIPYIHGSGLIGIGFSLVVVVIASLTLLLDLDFIDKQSGHAVKDMEWYGAFSLIVSLIWIYIELLKLLSKLKSND